MARRYSLRFFLRSWLVSRLLRRVNWRWRRFLGVMYALRVVRNVVVKRPSVHSVNVLTPGTNVYISTIATPTRRERRAARRSAGSLAATASPVDTG